MQTTKSLLACLLFCAQFFSSRAQSESDTTIATRQALFFADSLIKANFYQNWSVYSSLTCYSAIKYYGGPEGFKEHLVMNYYRNEPKVEEKMETTRMVSLMTNVDQWQCVIEKVRNTYIDERKATLYTYLVGQSLDNGQTWKFVDVSHNSMENLSHIMPAIFTSLPVPLGKKEFTDEVAMQQQTPEPPKKKAPQKRRK